jgi:hypothetical protein
MVSAFPGGRSAAFRPGPWRTTLSRAALEGGFVWAVWALLLAVDLTCIALYGRDIPLAEDWTLVGPLTGHEPDLLGWLWAQNNEHRTPLSKLVLLGLLKVTGGDFRAGMVASTGILAAASAVLVRTAAALRGGRVRWTDAVFPVLFLNLGNWENLVWSWQLQFTLSVALILVLLAAAVRPATARGEAWPAAGAVALALLPLTGASGLIATVGMTPWALYAAVTAPQNAAAVRFGRLRTPVRALYLGGAVLVALALSALYFFGYERPTWGPPNPGLGQSLVTATKVAAMGFGPVAAAYWPVFVPIAGLLLGSAVFCLVRSAPSILGEGGPDRRGALVGLVCFAGTAAVLVLAIGYGRAGYVPTVGLPARYAVLAAPALCSAHFVWERFASEAWRRGLQASLALVALLAIPGNVKAGMVWRDWYDAGMTAVERDLAAGMDLKVLASRHRAFLLHWNEGLLTDGVERLGGTGRGPFGARHPAPSGEQ